jgi:hypothetical protein
MVAWLSAHLPSWLPVWVPLTYGGITLVFYLVLLVVFINDHGFWKVLEAALPLALFVVLWPVSVPFLILDIRRDERIAAQRRMGVEEALRRDEETRERLEQERRRLAQLPPPAPVNLHPVVPAQPPPEPEPTPKPEPFVSRYERDDVL